MCQPFGSSFKKKITLNNNGLNENNQRQPLNGIPTIHWGGRFKLQKETKNP
jgi:hypothetical protein